MSWLSDAALELQELALDLRIAVGRRCAFAAGDRHKVESRWKLMPIPTEGLTHEAAAKAIGCPLGTLKGRLSKGREVLRSRLRRRGVAVGGLLLMFLLTEEAPAVPVALAESTARRMAAGDLAVRTSVEGSDDVAELGAALDHLATSLSSAMADLRAERDLVSGILDGMQEGGGILRVIGHGLAEPVLVDHRVARGGGTSGTSVRGIGRSYRPCASTRSAAAIGIRWSPILLRKIGIFRIYARCARHQEEHRDRASRVNCPSSSCHASSDGANWHPFTQRGAFWRMRKGDLQHMSGGTRAAEGAWYVAPLGLCPRRYRRVVRRVRVGSGG